MHLTVKQRQYETHARPVGFDLLSPEEKARQLACIYTAAWRNRNREKVKVYAAAYRKSGRASASQKKYRKRKLLENPRYTSDRIMEWRKKNKLRWNEIYRKSKLKRYRRDASFRISQAISGRIYRSLRKYGVVKSKSSLEFLGCSGEEFKHWMESQFKPGMSWENHGRFGWHIDHKRPISSFDLLDPTQLKSCFHFTNLQPLWWRENLEKAGKYNE